MASNPCSLGTLAKLPQEIRLDIYDIVLAQTCGKHRVLMTMPNLRTDMNSMPEKEVSMFLISKAISEELVKRFYQRTIFHYEFRADWYYPETIRRPLDTSQMQKISIRIRTLCEPPITWPTKNVCMALLEKLRGVQRKSLRLALGPFTTQLCEMNFKTVFTEDFIAALGRLNNFQGVVVELVQNMFPEVSDKFRMGKIEDQGAANPLMEDLNEKLKTFYGSCGTIEAVGSSGWRLTYHPQRDAAEISTNLARGNQSNGKAWHS